MNNDGEDNPTNLTAGDEQPIGQGGNGYGPITNAARGFLAGAGMQSIDTYQDNQNNAQAEADSENATNQELNKQEEANAQVSPEGNESSQPDTQQHPGSLGSQQGPTNGVNGNAEADGSTSSAPQNAESGAEQLNSGTTEESQQ